MGLQLKHNYLSIEIGEWSPRAFSWGLVKASDDFQSQYLLILKSLKKLLFFLLAKTKAHKFEVCSFQNFDLV